MNVTFDGVSLQNTLKSVKQLTHLKTSLPILSSVLIDVSFDGSISVAKFIATDLEIWYTRKDVCASDESFKFCLSKNVIDFILSIKKPDMVGFEYNEVTRKELDRKNMEVVYVDCNLKVAIGKMVKLDTCHRTIDFPNIPYYEYADANSFNVNSNVLISTIKRFLPLAKKGWQGIIPEDTIFLVGEGGKDTYMLVTDGNIAEGKPMPFDVNNWILINKPKIIKALLLKDSLINVGYNTTSYTISGVDYTINCKISSCTKFDYKSIVPVDKYINRLSFDVAELKNALTCFDKNVKSVAFDFTETTLTIKDTLGTISTSIQCNTTGELMRIKFELVNINKLINSIESSSIMMGYSHLHKIIILDDNDVECLIMPLQ